MKILQFPLTKVFIGFLTGLLLVKFITIIPVYCFIGLGSCFTGLLLCHFLIPRIPYLKSTFGYFTIATSILIGVSTAIVHKETLNPIHYIQHTSGDEIPHRLCLVLNEKLKNSSRNYRYISIVKKIDNYTSVGKILLNIPKNIKTGNLKIGTTVTLNGIIVRNKKPFNPNQFDYGAYLENQEIYAQVYSEANTLKIIAQTSDVWSNFSNFRNQIISNLERSKIGKEELNVLVALILGQQQDISPELLKEYQYAGAVHVLSVSGLHVGFIILFITFLLKPIGNSRKGSFIKLCIILIALWSFAILAGLLPSIIRSVTMFSFFAIGTHLKRTVNIYHTLMVSMLLILLFRPGFLFDVGFQLSYLAVFFILWFQPVLAQIWKPKNKISAYFWDIITVSFAAQLGAMPLSIYYFHQFPALFFLTNVLILPLLGIIMAVGVIAVLFATITTVPFYLAKIIEFLLVVLNDSIHWVASFDSFVWQNISFSKDMLCASYLVIVFFILWIKKPKFSYLAILFIGVVCLQCVLIYQKYNTSHQEELLIFSNKKNTILTTRVGKEVTLYSTDSILKNSKSNALIQSYLVGNFCRVSKKKPLKNVLYFKKQKILIIDSSCVYTATIFPDILIITQSPKLNLQRLLKTLKPKKVIVDGSNYKSYAALWETTCRKEKIPFHNTNEKGFYRL